MKNNTEVPYGDLLSILFANRNQAYGAYQLRRQYPNTVGRALGYGLGLVILFFAIPYLSSKLCGASGDREITEYGEIVLPSPPDIALETPALPPPVHTPPPPAPSTIKYVPPIVTADDKVPDEVPTLVEEILASKANVGSKTKQGNDNAPPSLVDNPELVLEVSSTARAQTDEPYEPFDVQKPPSFPGGEAELLNYLAKNIQYPPLAREYNIQGVVALTFIIGKDGKVREVKVLKDIGGGCGKEAQRIVESMPPWSPGEANGYAVSVRFTLPVRFRLQ